MKRIGMFGILTAVVLTAGCIMFPPQQPRPAHSAPSPQSVAEATPPQADLTQLPQTSPELTSPPAEEANACHADRYQNLVGQTLANVDRSDLPAHRVICMGCMATMDFVADRLTIHLGPGDAVVSVGCG